MRVSDFALRLRQAEIAQRREDEAKLRRGERQGPPGGAQAVTGPGELLRRRAEREVERKEQLERDNSENAE